MCNASAELHTESANHSTCSLLIVCADIRERQRGYVWIIRTVICRKGLIFRVTYCSYSIYLHRVCMSVPAKVPYIMNVETCRLCTHSMLQQDLLTLGAVCLYLFNPAYSKPVFHIWMQCSYRQKMDTTLYVA